MSIYDCVSMKSKPAWFPDLAVEHNQVIERLMSAWISAIAALTFLTALVLAAVQIIEWRHVAYVYVSISFVTLALAVLVYVSRRDA
ncbi:MULTISPECIES: hypothetical protein [Rhodomicrobium]|uniref:hypothetical protein n=1 Tax=Rhodomicrobium TaxID=1068 RepID=UPI000B4BC366|nr:MULTISPECIES: hypothetical protein [Rhodomicrobium]